VIDLRPAAVQVLLDELEQLPGVGPRTAVRLAQHLLRQPAGARRLAAALVRAADGVRPCAACFLPAEEETCAVCRASERDRALLCVVEDPINAWSIEATGEFDGLYHVLLGTLDPLHGVGPEQLTVAALVDRVRAGPVQEVILATNPTVEGEATAHFVAGVLKGTGVRVSRIAFGLPAGGEISFADQVTLSRSLVGRQRME
jgi:recombination protein RecR